MKYESNSLISIIVPVYNAEDYLAQCIQSIIGQSYRNIELILVNDGSTDTSASICDELMNSDNRIKVIHKENGGVSSARNTGLQAATGQFVLFADSDDYLEEDMLEVMLESIERNNSDVAICGYYQVKETGRVKVNPYSTELLNKTEAVEACFNHHGWDVSIWNKLFRAAALIKNGSKILFDTSMTIGEDAHWLIEVLDNSSLISCCNCAKYNYRFDRIGSAVYNSKKKNKLKSSIARYTASKTDYDFLIENYSGAAYFMCRRMLFSARDIVEEAYLQGNKEICKEYIGELRNAIKAYIRVKRPNRDIMFIIKVIVLYIIIRLNLGKKAVLFISGIKK